MKRSLPLAFFLCVSHFLLAQSSHLSLIHDFEGENFDYSVTGMIGTNDSLYVISFTPDRHGQFFRIDGNGDGYKVIWKFDADHGEPNSIISAGDNIYITTRFSKNGGGSLYRYSLTDYSVELIKDFHYSDVQEIQIKYVIDNKLWFISFWSGVDDGSVFTTDTDGNNIEKIFQATSPTQARNPIDFFFHENKIYIACWGGGNLSPNGDGTSTYCGSFIRINSDGTGYENIIAGSDQIGSQPQSIVIRENKLYGLFAYSGNRWNGQLFRSNLDGTEYDSLGALPDRALTQLLSTDSLIYAISSSSIVGLNPNNGETRIFDDLNSNPDFGADIVSDPAYLNGNVFITAQQEGPNGGGTILKWINKRPEVNESYFNSAGARLQDTTPDVDLNQLFSDPEGDLLTFSWRYDATTASVTESNEVLTVTPLIAESVTVTITARDGWSGRRTAELTINTDGSINVTITGIDEESAKFFLYPNPAYSTLKLSISNVKSIDILSADGKVSASYQNPGESIDISSFQNGVYFVRAQIKGKTYVQKIIKR